MQTCDPPETLLFCHSHQGVECGKRIAYIRLSLSLSLSLLEKRVENKREGWGSWPLVGSNHQSYNIELMTWQMTNNQCGSGAQGCLPPSFPHAHCIRVNEQLIYFSGLSMMFRGLSAIIEVAVHTHTFWGCHAHR